MSLFCNTGCRNTCGCNCTCNTTTTTAVEAATTETTVPTVRALLNTVLDSCCTTDDVCREISFNLPECFDPDLFEVGTALDVEINGDIFFKEVTRNMNNCTCLSTARYSIPVRIIITSKCGGPTVCIDREITVIRSARLCCTLNSILTSYNTRVLAVSAIVSEVCHRRLTVTLCLLFRSCLQQTLLREYEWQATPICVDPNCNDARKNLNDPCDVVCGCVEGITCPTC